MEQEKNCGNCKHSFERLILPPGRLECCRFKTDGAYVVKTFECCPKWELRVEASEAKGD